MTPPAPATAAARRRRAGAAGRARRVSGPSAPAKGEARDRELGLRAARPSRAEDLHARVAAKRGRGARPATRRAPAPRAAAPRAAKPAARAAAAGRPRAAAQAAARRTQPLASRVAAVAQAAAARPLVAPLPHAPARPRRAPRPVPSPARPAARRGLVGRALAWLGRLPDHRLLDRLIGGRVWIVLVCTLLVGLVTLQLSLLKLNAGIGAAVERSAKLEERNAALRVSNSRLSDPERIMVLGARMGLVMPPQGTPRYRQATPGDVSAALRTMRVPDAAAAGAAAAADDGAADPSATTAADGTAVVPAG